MLLEVVAYQLDWIMYSLKMFAAMQGRRENRFGRRPTSNYFHAEIFPFLLFPSPICFVMANLTLVIVLTAMVMTMMVMMMMVMVYHPVCKCAKHAGHFI